MSQVSPPKGKGGNHTSAVSPSETRPLSREKPSLLLPELTRVLGFLAVCPVCPGAEELWVQRHSPGLKGFNCWWSVSSFHLLPPGFSGCWSHPVPRHLVRGNGGRLFWNAVPSLDTTVCAGTSRPCGRTPGPLVLWKGTERQSKHHWLLLSSTIQWPQLWAGHELLCS